MVLELLDRHVPIHDDLTRRGLFGGAGGLGVLAALPACGSDRLETAAPAPGGDSAFPVTITHKFGTSVITSPPRRVVTVGYQAHDAVLALGAIPVGVRGWEGDDFDAVFFPWARDALGGARPEILSSGELNFEQIAGVEARFAQARQAHPEFAGKTAVYTSPAEAGKYYVFGPKDPRSQFLDSLGFELPAEIATLTGDEFYAEISGEQLHLFESDALVVHAYTRAEQQALEVNPLYQKLAVARNGGDLFLVNEEVPSGTAVSFNSVLSLPYAIDELVPRLAAAVG